MHMSIYPNICVYVCVHRHTMLGSDPPKWALVEHQYANRWFRTRIHRRRIQFGSYPHRSWRSICMIIIVCILAFVVRIVWHEMWHNFTNGCLWLEFTQMYREANSILVCEWAPKMISSWIIICKWKINQAWELSPLKVVGICMVNNVIVISLDRHQYQSFETDMFP